MDGRRPGKSATGAEPSVVRRRRLGTATDESGTYRLTNVPAGTVRVRTTYTGFPAETLKYEEFRLGQPYYGADSQVYVDIQHVFLWNPNNWNKQLIKMSISWFFLKMV